MYWGGWGCNITKIAVTLLVIVFIAPDTGEDRAGISVSLIHYTTVQLSCRGSNEKILFLQSWLTAAVFVTGH